MKKYNISEYFGRMNKTGQVDVFNSDGSWTTRIDGCTTIYPVDENLSVAYEKTDGTGLTITLDDAKKINLYIESL